MRWLAQLTGIIIIKDLAVGGLEQYSYLSSIQVGMDQENMRGLVSGQSHGWTGNWSIDQSCRTILAEEEIDDAPHGSKWC
jgi:hypothetical protein